jgi:hypothetical protein
MLYFFLQNRVTVPKAVAYYFLKEPHSAAKLQRLFYFIFYKTVRKLAFIPFGQSILLVWRLRASLRLSVSNSDFFYKNVSRLLCRPLNAPKLTRRNTMIKKNMYHKFVRHCNPVIDSVSGRQTSFFGQHLSSAANSKYRALHLPRPSSILAPLGGSGCGLALRKGNVPTLRSQIIFIITLVCGLL